MVSGYYASLAAKELPNLTFMPDFHMLPAMKTIRHGGITCRAASLSAFGAELAGAARTLRFWGIVARNAIPPVGVLALGWPATQVAFYFIFESWLFLSLRMAIDFTLDPKYGGTMEHGSTKSFLTALLKQFIMCGLLMGMLLGLVVGFAVLILVDLPYLDKAWESQLGTVCQDLGFLAALAVLVSVTLRDTMQFARRYTSLSPEQKRADDDRIATMFFRVVALAVASFVLVFVTRHDRQGFVLVLAMMFVLVWFEAMPRHALAVFDSRRRKALARPQLRASRRASRNRAAFRPRGQASVNRSDPEE